MTEKEKKLNKQQSTRPNKGSEHFSTLLMLLRSPNHTFLGRFVVYDFVHQKSCPTFAVPRRGWRNWLTRCFYDFTLVWEEFFEKKFKGTREIKSKNEKVTIIAVDLVPKHRRHGNRRFSHLLTLVFAFETVSALSLSDQQESSSAWSNFPLCLCFERKITAKAARHVRQRETYRICVGGYRGWRVVTSPRIKQLFFSLIPHSGDSAANCMKIPKTWLKMWQSLLQRF